MPESQLSPVSDVAPGGDQPTPGIGICLSGGGYRAMLFHAGVLLRLAEFGLLGSASHVGRHGPLGSLQRISSVSGGSITAAALGLAWDRLHVDQPDPGARVRSHLVEPIEAFSAHSTITLWSGLWSMLISTINKKVIRAYRDRLFGDATLQDLPDHPRFVINATNLQSGALWRFSKPFSRDWRVGEIRRPTDPLAQVVAASSAFPPFLSPAKFSYAADRYEPGSGADLQRPPFTTGPILSDGGVYDNLGLETVYKRCGTVIVSDGGGGYGAQGHVDADWARQSYRVLNTIDNQVRSLRKRILLEALTSRTRLGTYIGIRGDISTYPAPDTLPCPLQRTQALADLATDLAAKDASTRRRLINWGYAIADAGIRAWVIDGLPPPRDFPYPHEGV